MFLIQSSGGGHHYTQHKTSQIIGGGGGGGRWTEHFFKNRNTRQTFIYYLVLSSVIDRNAPKGEFRYSDFSNIPLDSWNIARMLI